MEICILGDFCPRHQSDVILESRFADVIDEKLLSLIQKADLSIVNVECPMTFSNRRFIKSGPHLKIPPEFARFLKDCGFHLTTLANNHIYDYGHEGLKETLEACRRNGMETVGAGYTVNEAQKTYFRSTGGACLAVVNVAENESCAATNGHGGAHPLDVIENVRRIKMAANEADFVLVIVHGGNELCPYPSPQVVQRYRFFIENGAHAIVAHHPHVIQGYEIYHGAPIIYSLGNFLFPLQKKGMLRPFADSWSKGMGVCITFPFMGEESLKLFPFHQCFVGPMVIPYSTEEEASFANYLLDLSRPIDNRETLDRIWKDHLYEQANTLLWYLSFGSLPMQAVRKVLSKMGLLGLLTRNRSRKNFLRLQAMRTEAQRELLIGTLDDIFHEKVGS